jgi:hypothetical protein
MQFHPGDLVVNRRGCRFVVASVSASMNRVWVKPPEAGYGMEISMTHPDLWELA